MVALVKTSLLILPFVLLLLLPWWCLEEIQHEIDIWRKAVHSLSEYSRDESHVRDVLSKKVRKLVRQKSKKSAYARYRLFL